MLQWHTQHRLVLSLNTEVFTVKVQNLDWPQEKVEKKEKEEQMQERKVGLQYIGV